MPALEASRGRLVIVSSGGMYNTNFPKWEIATSLKGKYNGNLVYAYAKRGQVLLAEQWAGRHPAVAVVAAHPGWTLTEAVDAAYGDGKKWLEPMRTPWQGAEGIAWLLACPVEKIESGAFYLDRKPQVHSLPPDPPHHIGDPTAAPGITNRPLLGRGGGWGHRVYMYAHCLQTVLG